MLARLLDRPLLWYGLEALGAVCREQVLVVVGHAIQAHHEDVPPKSVLAILVQAADSLSGARPGARKELLESYVKRLEELENLAMALASRF